MDEHPDMRDAVKASTTTALVVASARSLMTEMDQPILIGPFDLDPLMGRGEYAFEYLI
jgi:O-methyltransferase involved in polyketide biosynthesis